MKLIRLDEISNITYGKNLPTKKLLDDGYPVFGANGQIGFYSEYLYEDEQLLISCRGAYSGKINFSLKQAYVTNNSLIVDFPIYQNILRKFYYYILQGTNKKNLITGTAQPQVTINNAIELKIPLPPLLEQKAIVSKIEQLFSELDNGIDNLKIAQKKLKIYRQAVLKKAFEGELTKEWREKQTDLPTAEALLEDIKEEREEHYLKQLEEWKGSVREWESNSKDGKKPSKPKKLKQYNTESKDLISNKWNATNLGSVIEEPKYGTSKKCTYEVNGTGVLRIPNIGNNSINNQDLKYASFTDDEKEQYRLNIGDILIIRSNGSIKLVGKTALISQYDEEYLYAGYLIRLRPYSQIINSKYLQYTLISHELRKQIERKAKSSSGVNNINSGELESLIIPIVSIEEQNQIVQEIESRLSVCDNIEVTIANALRKSEALRQSILKKAFEGKLLTEKELEDIKNNPEYESAQKLLERIQQERDK